MALIFNTTLTTDTGMQVSDAYGRVSVGEGYTGTVLQAYVDIFVSEAAFLAEARPIKTSVRPNTDGPYNRDINGTDLLNLAHDMLVTSLADQGVTVTKVLS